jgi:cytidylate kinase
MRRGRPGLLVTVDGPAASGKSTLARRLARSLRVPFLYTGGMYRALAWYARDRGADLSDRRLLAGLAARLPIAFRTGRGGGVRVAVAGRDVTEELMSPAISDLTSRHVAPVAEVRSALIARQRRFATPKGLVAEGRDCGSVVFPHAAMKFFLTASLDERARRRRCDLAAAGIRMPLARVRRDLRARDRRDTSDARGTLRVGPETWVIDSTRLEPEETLARMVRLVLGRAV